MAHRFAHPPSLACSVVIATRNRAATLCDCLARTAAACAALGDAEIIVVDNTSTDDTIPRLHARFPAVRCIALPINAGPVAKNAAIAQSRGRCIALLDDDAYPQNDALPNMLRHFADDPQLGAAVFDVTLPDGRREASAFDAVFIGAGTGLRRAALERIGFLPADFFMQAEEYDLSFRLIHAGFRIQRFADMPLMHLKSPESRLPARTTMLDVRNNLLLLARHLPRPLAWRYAAHWLARYWLMARSRDAAAGGGGHRRAFLAGASAGLSGWAATPHRPLSSAALETIFQADAIHRRLGADMDSLSPVDRPIILLDLGKNMPPILDALRARKVPIAAIADDSLGNLGENLDGIPIIPLADALARHPDAPCILTHASAIHAAARAADRRLLNRTLLSPAARLI